MTDKTTFEAMAKAATRAALEAADRAARRSNADAVATVADRFAVAVAHQAKTIAQLEARIAELEEQADDLRQHVEHVEHERDERRSEVLTVERRLDAALDELAEFRAHRHADAIEVIAGDALDHYGENLGVLRNHQDDDEYRARIEERLIELTQQQRKDEREIAEAIECCEDENA